MSMDWLKGTSSPEPWNLQPPKKEVLADFYSESILGPNRIGGVDDWVYYLGVYLT